MLYDGRIVGGIAGRRAAADRGAAPQKKRLGQSQCLGREADDKLAAVEAAVGFPYR